MASWMGSIESVQRGNPETARTPGIREAWESGLAVLKPTAAQLERGLSLHRESCVIDTFAFLPMLWNEQVVHQRNALVEAGISGNDFEFRSGLLRTLAGTMDQASGERFLEALKVTGLSGLVHTAAEGKCREEDIRRMAAAAHVCAALEPDLRQARSAADFHHAHKAGSVAACFSVNGPPCTGRLVDLDGEIRWLSAWYHLGVRLMHLSYNRSNPIATGCAERNDGGLTELGHEFVREMNRLGIVVDVPHSSEISSLQAADISNKPIMASHVGCRGVFDHMRNKSDAVLKAIAGTGGLVGIVGRPAFLGPQASLNTLLDHVDYAVDLIGADHVAIGTDTTWVDPWPEGLREKIPSSFTPRWWGAWWRQQTHGATASDSHRYGSLAWTNWPLITTALLMRGYREEQVRKLLGLNLLRVLEANMPSAEASAPLAKLQVVAKD